MGLALSLACMVGQENRFVNLLRQMRSDLATASAQGNYHCTSASEGHFYQTCSI
ncbi:MAG: hypothetical protein K8L99_09390 [Anaerolineae bacterium]|nr:hypothetical protein [Anaerolineae bacterium]